MTERNGRIIDMEEYEPGVFSPRPWWDVSLFWLLGWPIRQLWSLGWDWFGTIVLISGAVSWAVVDPMGMGSAFERLIRLFFSYMAGE